MFFSFHTIRVLFPAIFLILLIGCREIPKDRVDLEGEWNYVWGRDMDSQNIAEGSQVWSPFSFPGQPPNRMGDRFLLIQGEVEERVNTMRDPALYIHIALEDFSVYLDGTEIYNFGSLDNPNYQIPGFIYPHIIPLPLDSGGREIRILFHSSYDEFIGIDHSAYIGNLSEIKEILLIHDYPRYILSGFYFLIAICSLIFYISIPNNRLFLFYSILVLVNGGVTLIANYISLYYFSDYNSPVYFYNIFVYLIPVSFFIYIGELLKGKYVKEFRFGVYFYSVVAIFFTALVFLGKTSFINLEIYFNGFVLPGIGFLLYAVGRQALVGDIDSRIIFLGIFVVAIFTFHDILRDFGLIHTKVILYWYGLFIFLFFQGAILFRRIYSVQKNYELKENELLVAQKIQNSILPEIPANIGRWELTSFYQPMKEVGGDFYDLLMDDDGNIGVLILDVSGHGVGAAIIASMAKVSFSHCVTFLDRPEEVMKEMNRSLFGKMNENFATAFYIAIKKEEPICKFSTAGHPSGFLISHIDNDVMEFRTKSKPLGIHSTSEYTNSYIYLKEGDLICLYTDGITELMDSNFNEFGEERLKEVLLKSCLLPLPEIKSILIDEFKAWTKHPEIGKEDDLSFLLFRFNGSI